MVDFCYVYTVVSNKWVSCNNCILTNKLINVVAAVVARTNLIYLIHKCTLQNSNGALKILQSKKEKKDARYHPITQFV